MSSIVKIEILLKFKNQAARAEHKNGKPRNNDPAPGDILNLSLRREWCMNVKKHKNWLHRTKPSEVR